MDATEDISSPKVQRKLWRRVWIGLAIFVIVAPVLLWIAIDQGGKREWKRVQAELRAKGEPTTIAELELPSGDDFPDEDNFGSVTWLIGSNDGIESKAAEDLREKLQIFGRNRFSLDRNLKANGHAFIGMASDLEAYADLIDETADDLDVKTPKPEKGDAVSRISAYLDLHADVWEDLLQAADRPHSHPVPSYSKRLAEVQIPMMVSMPTAWQVSNLSKALKWRALVALRNRDTEMFLRCFEISSRLVELVGNEQNLIGVLVAITCHRVLQPALVEALWDEEFISALGETGLKRLQASQQRTNLQMILETSMRSELVTSVETLKNIPAYRSSADDYYMTPDYLDGAIRFAPKGWFLSSAAYEAELFDRHLFESFRKKQHMGEIINSAERMLDEVRSLGSLQRYNYFFVYMSVPAYAKIPYNVAYAEVRRRQGVIALALHRYQLNNGNPFPESLEKLVPTYLESSLPDPMDGAPMRYQLTDEPGGFRLWSIGFDGTDDDGKLDLPEEEPEGTRLYRDNFIGDWPWPAAPREFPRPESEE